MRYGGAMAACERVAYFRGEIAPEPAETLASLGVALKVMDRESCYAGDSVIPALFDSEEIRSLVALTPHVRVEGDFSEWIGDTPFAAQRASRDRFNIEALEAARKLFGSGFKLYDTRALFIRRDVAVQLGAEWAATLNKAGSLVIEEKRMSAAAAESIALSIALSKLQIEARELPMGGPLLWAEGEIEYENAVDLVRTSHHFNLDFDNMYFWNSRYLANPELGSGLGSRTAPRAEECPYSAHPAAGAQWFHPRHRLRRLGQRGRAAHC
jgi:hypothetical protein